MTCPADFAAAQAWHDRVRADAASGAPVTDHGRALLASARPWPDAETTIGECGGCHSSLCFTPAVAP